MKFFLLGTRVGRVRMIFRLSEAICRPGYNLPLPSYLSKELLVYVEWYTCQGHAPNATHGMYIISKAYDTQERRQGAVVPLSSIRQSCMLTPVFPKTDQEMLLWTSDNVLDVAESFYINNWQSKYSYQTIY